MSCSAHSLTRAPSSNFTLGSGQANARVTQPLKFLSRVVSRWLHVRGGEAPCHNVGKYCNQIRLARNFAVSELEVMWSGNMGENMSLVQAKRWNDEQKGFFGNTKQPFICYEFWDPWSGNTHLWWCQTPLWCPRWFEVISTSMIGIYSPPVGPDGRWGYTFPRLSLSTSFIYTCLVRSRNVRSTHSWRCTASWVA